SRRLQRRLEELRERAGARERELDLLVWELEEIEQAEPSEAEEERLVADRERLRHLEALRAAAITGLEALSPESEGDGAATALAAAANTLDSVRGVDAPLDALGGRLRALAVEADDLAAELRHYTASLGEDLDGGDASAGGVAAQLDAIEERLSALERLKRKHGGTIAAVLAHADDCRRRRAELEGAEEALADVEREIEAARAGLAEQAEALHDARLAAAARLETAVCERLAALAMPGASFRAALGARDAFGPTGADEVEFLIAPNPGVPAGPLRDTASGGELSRIMLALMSVAAQAGPATLVFDEIDAGVGGKTARAVGEELKALAAGRQVICITHLPQIASLADRHFTIVKDASGGTARTTVTPLERGDVVGEIVRMLGADAGDRTARRHAQELLRAA
ncbi:MAG: DNA repair protein RecN, partial [uncultured Solirubrobacteraceae bacterium]